MTVAAVIFDFDGVIVESVDTKTSAFAQLFRDEGDDAVAAIVDLHLRLGGVSRHEKFELIHRDILRRPLDEARRRALADGFAELVKRAVVDCPMVAGADDFLRGPGRRLKLFVVSGTPDDELRDIARQRGLDILFAEMHGSPRPKPAIIRDLLARHRLAPESVLFVGDALTDYDAAAETGLRFLGRVAPGERSPFPPGTEIVADLSMLAARIGLEDPV